MLERKVITITQEMRRQNRQYQDFPQNIHVMRKIVLPNLQHSWSSEWHASPYHYRTSTTLTCGKDALIQKGLVLPASDSLCSIIVVRWELCYHMTKALCSNLPRSNFHTLLWILDEVDDVSQSGVVYSSGHSPVILVPSNDVTKRKWIR